MSCVDFYDCVEAGENLTHVDVNTAVEYHLDQLGIEHWPDTLKVYAFKRMTIGEEEKRAWAVNAAERLLSKIDDEYGDPDGCKTPLTAIDAARVFVDAVLANYSVWSCEEVPAEAVGVSVANWVREHMPEWAGSDPAIAEWLKARPVNVL